MSTNEENVCVRVCARACLCLWLCLYSHASTCMCVSEFRVFETLCASAILAGNILSKLTETTNL